MQNFILIEADSLPTTTPAGPRAHPFLEHLVEVLHQCLDLAFGDSLAFVLEEVEEDRLDVLDVLALDQLAFEILLNLFVIL